MANTSLTLSQEKAWIFRITHRENVPWILENGMHCRNGRFNAQYKNIGNVDLIDKRSRRLVKMLPGGTLNDYVPFYFTPYSIMMFNIKTGYSGVTRVPNDDIVIFVSSLPHLQSQGVRFLFTNQHAYPIMAKYFSDLEQLGEIDWATIKERDFRHDPDDPGRKERYQAEALVWKHVPLESFLGVCCHSDAIQQEIESEIAQRHVALKVAVQPNWYFT